MATWTIETQPQEHQDDTDWAGFRREVLGNPGTVYRVTDINPPEGVTGEEYVISKLGNDGTFLTEVDGHDILVKVSVTGRFDYHERKPE